jgi:hypothetical protein
MKPFMEVTSDFTKNFNDAIKRFKHDSVLVGIPEDDKERNGNSPISNAALLAINNFGSPANNIPPRPIMAIGIKNAQPAIAEQFKLAAQNVLSKGPAALEQYYERAGIIASNSIKKVINDQDGIDAPAASTLKSRKYLTKSGFKGTKALLVTGQLRNAITYVVKTLWGR